MEADLAEWPLPDIAPDLIRKFDIFDLVETHDLHADLMKWFDGPRLFYSPCNGGHWVATRAEDIFEIYRDHDRFSNHGVALFREHSGALLIPGELDPPIHTAFRNALIPETSPRRMRELEAFSRKMARDLIAKIAPLGRCEFRGAISEKLPIYNFFEFVSLPLDDADDLIPPSNAITRGTSVEDFAWGMGQVKAYVQARIDERLKVPKDDFISRMLAADIDGRKIRPEECLMMVINVMLGGLDTTTGTMGFAFNFLGRNPEHRRQLRDDPSLIPEAIEELLRRHGIFNTGRLVKQDMEFRGFNLRENDLILVPTSLHNLDPERFPDPLKVDFHRGDKNHLTFGVGIHRCLGSNFARSQVRILLEEWFAAIPDFEVDPDGEFEIKSGRANTVIQLPLRWET